MSLTVAVPGFKNLELEHLLLDYNGTLARDGALIDGVAPLLRSLAEKLEIHVITADTYGTVEKALAGLPCAVVVIGQTDQAEEKRSYLGNLGAERTVAVGNGRNDAAMLAEAALGLAVVQEEGAFGGLFAAADAVFTSILPALSALEHPNRLVATLRN